MYYKNKENQPYYEPSQAIIKRDELIKITKEEFNQIVYEINNPPITEEQRVQNINSYTQSFITKKYPLEKQSSASLGIYGEEYKTEMISFISNCIGLSNEAIENNTSFEDFKAMLDEWRKQRFSRNWKTKRWS